MSSAVYVILPGSPQTPTGGFAYDRHVLAALRRVDWLAGVIVIDGDYPWPSATTMAAAEQRLAALPAGARVVVDGLALTPLLPVFERHAGRLSLFALIHHPLADETGLPTEQRTRLFEAERRALTLAQGVIVTSEHTAGRLADFDVPAERIRIVRPGVRGPFGAVHRCTHRPPVLLCVASLVPRKGQDVLLRALARLRHLDWRLQLVGPERDRAYAKRLRRLAQTHRLAARVSFVGAVAEADLARFYRRADIFVFPSHHEGYGIAVADAAAHGLPIVASDAGAISEAIDSAPSTLIPPGDVAALATALRPLLTHPQARVRRIGTGAITPRTWERVGQEFVAALESLMSRK